MSGADAAQPLPFRGARSFDETSTELFFGRRDEAAAAVQLALSVGRAGVILGEPGVGVTSLLRAGLVPALADQGVGAVYVDLAPPGNVEATFGQAIDRLANAGVNGTLGERMAKAVRGGSRGGVVVVIDHLDLLLATDRSSQTLTAVASLLSEIVRNGGDRLRLLFGSSEARFFALGQLEATLGPLFPGDARLVIPRFDARRTADIMEQSVLAGGVFVEAGFAQRLAEQLCADGPVLGLDIQLVMVAAAQRGIHTAAALRRAGGAPALKRQLIGDAVRSSGGRAALRLLDALVHSPSAPAPTSVELLAQAAGLEHNAAVRHLASLEAAGLVAMRTYERQGYASLTHEALGDAARQVVMAHHLRVDRARGELRAAVENRRALMPMGPRALLNVLLTLGTRSLRSDELAQVERSRRWWLRSAFALLGLPMLALLVSYAILASSFYLSLSTDGAETLVVRQGRPGLHALFWLPHTPRFGDVLVDTGFAAPALSTEGRERVKALVVAGSLLRIGARWRATPRWWPAVLEVLDEIPAAMAEGLQTERPGDEPKGGAKPAGAIGGSPAARLVAQAAANPARMAQVVDALAVAGAGTAGEAELFERLVRGSDERLRERVVWAVGAIGLRHPGAMSELLAQVAARDPSPRLRSEALAVAMRWTPAAQTPVLAAAIEGLGSSTAAGGGTSSGGGSSGGGSGSGSPVAAAIVRSAMAIARRSEADGARLLAALASRQLLDEAGVARLGELAKRSPDAQQTLLKLLKGPGASAEVRALAAEQLFVANPTLARTEVDALLERRDLGGPLRTRLLQLLARLLPQAEAEALALSNSGGGPAERNAALAMYGVLVGKGDVAALEELKSAMAVAGPRGEGTRAAAAAALGDAVAARNGAARGLLTRALRDPSPAVRLAAVRSFCRANPMGPAGLAQLTTRVAEENDLQVQLGLADCAATLSGTLVAEPGSPVAESLATLTVSLAHHPNAAVRARAAVVREAAAPTNESPSLSGASGTEPAGSSSPTRPSETTKASGVAGAAAPATPGTSANAGTPASPATAAHPTGAAARGAIDDFVIAAALPDGEAGALRAELTARDGNATAVASSLAIALIERGMQSPSERTRTAAVQLAGQLPARYRAALAARLRDAMDDRAYDVRQAARLALAMALAANERAEPLITRLQATSARAASRFVVTEALAMRAREPDERRVLETRLATGEGTPELFLTRLSLALARCLSVIPDDAALDRALLRLHGTAAY